jgi:cobalt-precorrin 5A hydrolase
MAGSSPAHSLAVYALTPAGAVLARSLAARLPADLFLCASAAGEGETSHGSFAALFPRTFRAYRGHVCVAAAGLVVRCLAPLLSDKASDPAVVVADQAGTHAVSLLSGHLGGANELARRVASLTGGTAVITTATDTAGLSAIDELARARGLAVENPEAIRDVSAAMLRGETVQIFDPEDWLGLSPEAPGYRLLARLVDWDREAPGVYVDFREGWEPPGALVLRPRCLHLGLGCRKGVPARDILAAVRNTVFGQGYSPLSLASAGSAEIKAEEPGLLEALAELGITPRFFSLDDIRTTPGPTPSPLVAKHIGVDGVCEAVALLLSPGGRLILPKTKTSTVTLALARSWP